ncbi:hypothetical protein PLESTB_000351500 [Pleodorina starrii]|uniref:Uncharacterized protein n=1 Tax=Pleodorina starrii TaxID=330485 RepID=A0A9W6BED0_9CHLO|nr:hypothetical protein PLESTB_000351500 [Pleodorina starrii]
MADPEAEVEYKNESDCLILEPDSSGSTITKVTFTRSVPDVHARVAELLKLPETERVRCFHLPFFEKVLGWSVHMYLDLDAVEHGMQHNTNATQLWLIANLPSRSQEPVCVCVCVCVGMCVCAFVCVSLQYLTGP